MQSAHRRVNIQSEEPSWLNDTAFSSSPSEKKKIVYTFENSFYFEDKNTYS